MGEPDTNRKEILNCHDNSFRRCSMLEPWFHLILDLYRVSSETIEYLLDYQVSLDPLSD